MNTITNCPVCNNNSFKKYLECKDYTVSQETFNIVKCNECDFTFTNPIPLEKEIGGYYESEEYISHSNTKKGIVNGLYQTVRNHTLDKKVSLLKSLSNGKELLDIGSGTGEFLNRSKQAGYNITGVEPSKTGRDQAQQNFNIPVHEESYLSNIPSESLNFITMWHVLEHVYHLNERVGDLKRLIKPGGHIIIAVPNHNSWDANHYKEHWAAFDVPRHLYHFTPNTIIQLFKKHDLKHVKTLPMKFDSYYVSMLSEKYKTGKVNLVKAFLNGLTSNNKAEKDQSYSSQIYIFTK